MGNYTNPDAAGCLLEAEACAQVIRELERLAEKFKRKIEREAEKRREELRAALEYERRFSYQNIRAPGSCPLCVLRLIPGKKEYSE